MPNWGWAALLRTPGLGNSLMPFKDKAYKLGPALGAMRGVNDLYKALVTEWTEGAAPALGAVAASTRLDELGFADRISEPSHRMMLLDGVTYLPDDILVKVDRAAMAVSLETRIPMLDHRVAETAWRLPMSMKIRDGRGKWALRQYCTSMFRKGLVERPKAGFAIPIGQWLRGPLRDWGESLLSETRLKKEGYLDSGEVLNLWRDHCSGRRDWTFGCGTC